MANSAVAMALCGKLNYSLTLKLRCWRTAAVADRTGCKAVLMARLDERRSCITTVAVKSFPARRASDSRKVSALGLSHQGAADGALRIAEIAGNARNRRNRKTKDAHCCGVGVGVASFFFFLFST